MRQHPIRGGTRFHAGIDLAAPMGTPTRTIGGGQVIRVGNTDPNGYGLVVAVRTPSGYIEHFAHLDSAAVRVGDVIQPGTHVGNVGSSGGSTGPHLDLSIWKPGHELYRSPVQSTINPRHYFKSVRSAVASPRGVGAAPASQNRASQARPVLSSTVTDGFSQNFRSLYESVSNLTRNRVGMNPSSSVSSAAPRATPRAAMSRHAYPPGHRNNPEHNFGYEVIQNDRAYRLAIHRTAASLNIPTQWLADVADFESNHRADVVNGEGCVGLLQACPGGMLADLSQKWNVNRTQAAQRLRSMGRAQQIGEFGWWLGRYSNNGRNLDTIEDLYALVLGGPRGLSSPSWRARMRDSNGSFTQHIQRLGNRVGRRYESTYDRTQSNVGNTHTHMVAGCTTCNQMQSQSGTIMPHVGGIG